MTSRPNLQKGIHNDMLVQASEKGQEAYIGRVVGLKYHRYIKLSKQGMLDGKRRYVPLEWVHSIKGNIVRLGQTASSVRHGWLSKAELKADLKAGARAASRSAASGSRTSGSGKSGG
jgi:hypothetical protein